MTKAPRGFALLTPSQRSKLGRKGGKRSSKLGTAYRWDSKSAAKAGRKGGKARGKASRKRQEARNRLP